MIERSHEATFGNVPATDVIVVGSGAVGLTLAIELVRKGLNVTVLEAGPSKPSSSSQRYFETATMSGHSLPGLHLGRFRCLGGTTNFWGGQLLAFSPNVFRKRPWVSDVRWPIDHSDLSLYYDRAFNILGMAPVIRDDELIWRKIDVEAPPSTHSIQPFFTRWTPESNLALHFRNEILREKQLRVIMNAQVSGIVMEGEEVKGVEVRTLRNGTLHRTIMRAPRVVLANGTVEIVRLLQLPLTNGREPHWSKNPWLGRCFMDHVDCFAGTVRPIDRKRFAEIFDTVVVDGLKYSPKLRVTETLQEADGLLEAAAHFVYKSALSENIHNLKILLKGLLKGRLEHSVLLNPFLLFGAMRFVFPMAVRYIRHRRIMNFSDGGIFLRITSEQAPLKESCIFLSDSEVDELEIPTVNLNWSIASDTVRSLSCFSKYLKDYLEQQGLAEVELDPRLSSGNEMFLSEVDDSNHHMGGARMAVHPSEGVVSKDCEVFGAKGLYVAGAAVFPTSGFGNPTFTAIALSLRLAEHIVTAGQRSHHAE